VVYADAAVASESEGNVSVIKVDDVAFVRFRAPDLATMKSFLQDFGMQEAASTDRHLFMRGHGPAPFLHATELGEPGFVGVAFRARSLADLERLADSEKVPIDDLDAQAAANESVSPIRTTSKSRSWRNNRGAMRPRFRRAHPGTALNAAIAAEA
jgi:hypothetical protein